VSRTAKVLRLTVPEGMLDLATAPRSPCVGEIASAAFRNRRIRGTKSKT
jgi:hypothetical protein